MTLPYNIDRLRGDWVKSLAKHCVQIRNLMEY